MHSVEAIRERILWKITLLPARTSGMNTRQEVSLPPWTLGTFRDPTTDLAEGVQTSAAHAASAESAGDKSLWRFVA